MQWYMEHEGGPATLDGLTSAEVKRLLGSLVDRGLKPNTVHGFFEVVRAFANWALREGFPVDLAVIRMRPPKVPETELETYTQSQQETILAAAAPGWPPSCRANPARYRDARRRTGGAHGQRL